MVQSFRGSFSFPAGKLEDDETEAEGRSEGANDPPNIAFSG